MRIVSGKDPLSILVFVPSRPAEGGGPPYLPIRRLLVQHPRPVRGQRHGQHAAGEDYLKLFQPGVLEGALHGILDVLQRFVGDGVVL